MQRIVTLRLDEKAYAAFREFAERERRPISNCITHAALQHLEECRFVDELEMEEIRSSPKLLRKLKQGSKEARQRTGRLLE